jgi:hypothetical protein
MYQQVPSAGEVSLWESELKHDGLPQVCCKSGHRADGTLRVQFQNNPSAAWAGFVPGSFSRRYVMKGRLPISTIWLFFLTTARFVVVAALVAFIYGLWGVDFGGQSTAAWIALIAGLLALQLWTIFRERLEPTGRIYRDAAANTWVRVRGVHPGFVAAVDAYRTGADAPAVPLLSPDGAWAWSGQQWIPALGSSRKSSLREWVTWIVNVGAWVVIGIAAWSHFHS